MMGRPITGSEKKERYQVALEPCVAEKIRDLGGGNLSQGIASNQAINARLASIAREYHSAFRDLAGGTNSAEMRKVALKAFLSFTDALNELDAGALD